MKKERSKFTPEFKLEAVSLVLNKNYTVMQACAALEIGPTALRRWIKQYKQEQQGIVPEGCIALSPEQRQIQELQKRIERLELEKDILKKATVSSTGQRKYALQLLQRCQVVECFPRSFIQLPCKFI